MIRKSSCSRAKPSQALQYGRHFGTLFFVRLRHYGAKARHSNPPLSANVKHTQHQDWSLNEGFG